MDRPAPRTILITGSNTGIGKATAVALARFGATIVLTARDPKKGEQARQDVIDRTHNEDVHLLQADFSSLESTRALAGNFKQGFRQLDVLINNAGAMLSNRRVTEDGLEMTFQVNHLASFLLTGLLLDRLKAAPSARIVNLSSDAHRLLYGGLPVNFNDLQSAKWYRGMRAYAQSKLANVLFTRELARRLEGASVSVNAVHPGAVNTEMASPEDGRGLFATLFNWTKPLYLSPEDGARTSVYVATAPELEGVTGGYFRKCKQVRLDPLAKNEAAGKRLWEVSEELSGFVYPI